MSSTFVNYKLSQIVQLEGNFNDTFDFYVPPGLATDALTVLAPNFMQILQESSASFDVEIFGHNLYLLTSDPLYSPEVIEVAMTALSAQLTYMRRLETSWSYTPQTEPFDLLQIEAVSSKVVKVGRVRFKLLYLVLIAFLAICLLLILLPQHSVTL